MHLQTKALLRDTALANSCTAEDVAVGCYLKCVLIDKEANASILNKQTKKTLMEQKDKKQQKIKKQFNKNGITKLLIIEDNLKKGKSTN